MFDWRIYRAAAVPLLLALLVVAFSLVDPPRPLTSTLAPDAFDGSRAFGLLTDLAARYPDRRPGSPGDEALARLTADAFRTPSCGEGSGGCRAAFRVRVRRFEASTIDGRRQITTVMAQRAGVLSSQIVLVAHRDAAARRAKAELSATAALLELAHVFAGRVTQHSLALVSTSGGSGGDAGAANLAAHAGGPVDAVLVLGDLAGTRQRRPVAVPWSDGLGVAPLRLRRTMDWAVTADLGRPAGASGAAAQLARLAFPVTLGEQGTLLARGLPAVLLQASGERGPPRREAIGEPALQGYGRAALRAVSALDTGSEIASSPERDLGVGRKVLPAWAIRLLLGALLIPPMLVGIDGFARARRRRERMSPGLGWALTDTAPFVAAGAFAIVAGRLGLLGPAPPEAVLPSALPVNGLALGAVGLVFAVGWLARPLLLRRLGIADASATARAPATGPVVLLALCVLALIVWVANPYASLLVIPALHLWLIPIAPELRVRRWLAVLIVALGAIPLALLIASYLAAFGLSPLEGAWMALLLVAGGHVGPGAVLMWSLILGGGVAVLAISARRALPAAVDPPAVTVRGPVGYAGPGSLGGTRSALRR